MYKIISNEEINTNVYKIVIESPLIALKFKPGEYAIVMANKDSERIPLTIVDVDNDNITMIYQVVGASTLELSHMSDNVYSLVGPLGNPSELIKEDLANKNILLVGGGIGIAAIYPQAKYFYEHGANVDIVYGVKTKDLVIMEDDLKNVSSNLIISTDDGSYGLHGNVVDAIKTLNKTYDVCVSIGPMIMMKYVSLYTKTINLRTIVSLNPVMVDGTGMCGACRILVNNEVKFACIDGPEFDGHLVDFDLAIKRLNIYKTEEGRAYLKEQEGSSHHGGCGNCGD